MENLTHWKGQVNPDYLGAYAIPPEGSLILTIKMVRKELVSSPTGEKKECLVVHWMESFKPMVCNRTNGKTIERVVKSPYIEQWVGKKVELYSSRVKAFGEEMDALRVKAIAPEVLLIDTKPAIEKLKTSTTLEELKVAYTSLTQDEQNHIEVVKIKDQLKAKLK